MRLPPEAYRPERRDERNQDRWNRRPRPSQYPPRVSRRPLASTSRARSSSQSLQSRLSSKASSDKTLVPLSASSIGQEKSRRQISSDDSSVWSKERYSGKPSENEEGDYGANGDPTSKGTSSASPPESTDSLPSTVPEEAPQGQVAAVLASLKEPEEKRRSTPRRVLSNIKWVLLDQWFLLAFALLVIIASQKQVPTPDAQAIKQTITSYVCVSIIFFVTGCTLPTKVLLENYTRWKTHLVVQGQGFLMTSAITFGIVCALNKSKIFDPYDGMKRPQNATPSWLLVGLLFMGCVPTSISSNVVLTQQAHGNMAFTVVQSTIGNFVAPFLTPVLMNMYTGNGSPFALGSAIPQKDNYSQLYARVFKQLGLSVFLPMILGQIVQNLFPNKTKLLLKDWKLSKLSSISLLIILWQTVDQAFWAHHYYRNLAPPLVIKSSQIAVLCLICPVLFIFWLAIAFGTFIFWLPRRDTIAACYCIPAKTPSLGVPLSMAMYVGLTVPQQSSIQIPLVIFQALQIVVGSLLTVGFRRWLARHEKERKKAAASRNVSCFSADAAASGIDSDLEKGPEPISDEDREFVARRMSRWRVGMMNEFEEVLSQYHIA